MTLIVTSKQPASHYIIKSDLNMTKSDYLLDNSIPDGITSLDDYFYEFDSVPNESSLLELFEIEKKHNPKFWFKKVRFNKAEKVAYVAGSSSERNDYGNPLAEFIFEQQSDGFTKEDVNDWFDHVISYGHAQDYFEVDFEEKTNQDFWHFPSPLYHATTGENLPLVLKTGLKPKNITRGLTNRGVGAAVFTSTNPEAIDSYTGNDGGIVVIDTSAMKKDGYMPVVGQEPEITEKELESSLAHAVGITYNEEYSDSGMDTETFIVYGGIPAKYIKLYDSKNSLDEIIDEPKRAEPKTIKQLGVRKNAGVKNIIAVYNDATPEEKDYWGKWYHHAKENVQELATKYGINFPVMAAVVAVLSPGNKWALNLYAAERTVQSMSDPSITRINAYPRQVQRAKEILETGNIGLVTGPKVSVFFKSLLDPSSVERELVLDSHAINIWRGAKLQLRATTLPTKLERIKMVEDYQKAAEQLGVPVQAVQAVTWYVWKYIAQPPKIPTITLPVKKKKKTIVEVADLYQIIEEETKALMKKMGYNFVGNNYRLGSDTYIQKDDPNPSSSKKYINIANKNINKGKPGKGKDTLHDPPAVGVSLPKKMRG